MDSHRLKAYLNLIQELLTCPSDEEWIRLRQHEDLVNLELVQIMEQVAAQLSAEGDGNAARFLHNWAGRLYHILAQPLQPPQDDPQGEAYLALIQALLTCPEPARGELLLQHQELIGPGLVQTMQQVAAQMEAQGNKRASRYLQQLAAALNRQWLQAQEFQSDLAKMAARPDQEETKPFHKSAADSPRKPLTRHSVESSERETTAEATAPKASVKTAKQVVPQGTIVDPWEDSPVAASEMPPDTASVNASNANVPEVSENTPKPSPEAATPSPSDPPPDAVIAEPTAPESDNLPPWQQIERQLGAIATALNTLNEHLAHQTPQRDPLWYLDTLERAQQAGWLLATEEVEQLIGVKPSSSGKDDRFERGCWVFVKAGKIGAQTAWRVEKLSDPQS